MIGINITAPGPNGVGAEVFEASTGQEIKGVMRLSVEFAADDFTRAHAEIAASAVTVDGAVASFYVVDPATGDPKEVKRIEFEDGTSWACDQLAAPSNPSPQVVPLPSISAPISKVFVGRDPVEKA